VFRRSFTVEPTRSRVRSRARQNFAAAALNYLRGERALCKCKNGEKRNATSCFSLLS
jgi:hypothetical protein